MGDYYHTMDQVQSRPRKVDVLLDKPTVAELESVWPKEKVLAIDFETRGTDPTAVDFAVVGLGIASESKVIYVHLVDIQSDSELWIKEQLTKHDLMAFNVGFDGAVARRWTGKWLKWTICTYALFRLLATEGYVGQRWNLAEAQEKLLGWPVSNKIAMEDWLAQNLHFNHNKTLDKSQMWQAPFDIIGPYCALDADACWQLYEHVFKGQLDRFPGLKEYAERFSMCLIKLVVEQQFVGIRIDVDKLVIYHEKLLEDIHKSQQDFLNLPVIFLHIDEFNQQKVSEHEKKSPQKMTKSRTISKNWIKWEQKRQDMLKTNQFNLNSDQQLRWLFYDCLKFPVTLKTEGGHPAISGKVLGQFGEPGKLLIKYNELCKEEGYVKTCLEHVRDGEVHIPLKIHGTLTGRCAGSSGLNLQQIPHSEGYMSCWVARPRHVWIDFDVASLEPVVLAELSEDSTLMKLYGPDAKPNDIYLFLAANLEQTKHSVRKWYNPQLPTEQSIKDAKEHCRTERQLAKVLQLSMSYGAGPNKIKETLSLAGIYLSFAQVQQMYYEYWKLYKGVKDYEQRLMQEWNDRGGWVYNGLGRPLAVDYNMTKDLVNRVVQSTGHDILVILLYFVDQLRLQSKLAFSFVFADFHDQMIVECKEDIGIQVKELINRALELTNEYLVGTIKIRGTPQIVRTLWEAKA